MYNKNSVVLKELSFVSITFTHAKKVLEKLSFDSITLKHAKKEGLQVTVHKISHWIQTYFDNLLINSVQMIDNYIKKNFKNSLDNLPLKLLFHYFKYGSTPIQLQ